jgi:hypothetical protein
MGNSIGPKFSITSFAKQQLRQAGLPTSTKGLGKVAEAALEHFSPGLGNQFSDLKRDFKALTGALGQFFPTNHGGGYQKLDNSLWGGGHQAAQSYPPPHQINVGGFNPPPQGAYSHVQPGVPGPPPPPDYNQLAAHGEFNKPADHAGINTPTRPLPPPPSTQPPGNHGIELSRPPPATPPRVSAGTDQNRLSNLGPQMSEVGSNLNLKEQLLFSQALPTGLTSPSTSEQESKPGMPLQSNNPWKGPEVPSFAKGDLIDFTDSPQRTQSPPPPPPKTLLASTKPANVPTEPQQFKLQSPPPPALTLHEPMPQRLFEQHQANTLLNTPPPRTNTPGAPPSFFPGSDTVNFSGGATRPQQSAAIAPDQKPSIRWADQQGQPLDNRAQLNATAQEKPPREVPSEVRAGSSALKRTPAFSKEKAPVHLNADARAALRNAAHTAEVAHGGPNGQHQKLLNRLAGLRGMSGGAKGTYTEQDIEKAGALVRKAPLTINFRPEGQSERISDTGQIRNPTTLSGYLETGRLQNAFEARSSGGSIDVDWAGRFAQDDKIHQGYQRSDKKERDATAANRPIAATANLYGSKKGGSPEHGGAHFVLKEAVKERVTYSYNLNSREMLDAQPRDVGSGNFMSGVLNKMPKDALQLLMRTATGNATVKTPKVGETIDGHIHGGVDFSRDIEHLVLPDNLRGTPAHREAAELSQKHGFPLKFESEI